MIQMSSDGISWTSTIESDSSFWPYQINTPLLTRVDDNSVINSSLNIDYTVGLASFGVQGTASSVGPVSCIMEGEAQLISIQLFYFVFLSSFLIVCLTYLDLTLFNQPYQFENQYLSFNVCSSRTVQKSSNSIFINIDVEVYNSLTFNFHWVTVCIGHYHRSTRKYHSQSFHRKTHIAGLYPLHKIFCCAKIKEIKH